MPSSRDDIHEVELLGLRDAVRVVVILGSVGLRAVQIHGHAQSGFGVGNVLHAMRDFFAALRVLAVKLRDQRVGALAVKFLERAPRGDRHAPGHGRDGGDDRHHEEGQQLGAESSWRVPPDVDGPPSQTSSRLQPPQRGAIQSRTCGPSP